MKALLLLLGITIFSISNVRSQSIEGTEIGFDVQFSISSFNGNAGLGLKYGWKYGDYLIFGPSVRYQRSWFNNPVTAQKGGFNVYGGGGFAHARFYNVLFVGTEFEMLRSPYTFSGQFDANSSNWVATWLFGGGFSMEFEEKFRINAGIMYDVLDIRNINNPSSNNPNSPLQPYLASKQDGTKIPIIYRISFFIPLG